MEENNIVFFSRWWIPVFHIDLTQSWLQCSNYVNHRERNMKPKTCKVPRVNRCQWWCWKKGLADMGDWSSDIDRWYTLKPFRVLLCQGLLGVSLNACTNVMDLQWKFKGNVGEIIHRQMSKHPIIGQSGMTQPSKKFWKKPNPTYRFCCEKENCIGTGTYRKLYLCVMWLCALVITLLNKVMNYSHIETF